MSTILDALRRGRARRTPRHHPNDAQTDAVLQTLGYGRPVSQSSRAKRIAGFLTLGVVIAVLLSLVVFRLAQAYM